MAETAPGGEPVDCYGAGDAFAAGTAVAKSATHGLVETASLANIATSITGMKHGVGAASP